MELNMTKVMPDNIQIIFFFLTVMLAVNTIRMKSKEANKEPENFGFKKMLF